MDQNQPPKSNAGTVAAILGGLAVLGGAVALAGSKSQPKLGGARGRVRLKKPCGCGR